MIIDTSTPVEVGDGRGPSSDSTVRTLIGRITRLEAMVGALIGAVMVALVVIEPNILEAPFQNTRTLLFTFGGTVLAAMAFVAMLWLRVPAVVRVVVLVVPLLIVNSWLISPYFVDDVVDEDFAASISEQVVTTTTTTVDAPAVQVVTADDAPAVAPASLVPLGDAPVSSDQTDANEPALEMTPSSTVPAAEEPPTPPPSAPLLLGAGRFVGLAGHSGTGDAGIFQNADGSLVLRFENFDIENGPDLEVYLVPGPDQISLPEGSIHLGALKGNIGDQNYELPAGTELAPGGYTVLVWCEAFSVEFVGATVIV